MNLTVHTVLKLVYGCSFKVQRRHAPGFKDGVQSLRLNTLLVQMCYTLPPDPVQAGTISSYFTDQE